MTSASPKPTPNHLAHIRRISRWMVGVCVVLVVLLPLALVFYWATTSAPDLAQQGNLRSSAIQAQLQDWQRWVAGAVTAVPLAMLLVGVWQAKRCFAQFAQGLVFTSQATDYLRRFAGWVAAAALAAIVAGAATSVLLTLHNPPGMRHLAVGVGSSHVLTLFFAGVVWLMANIIGQGQTLAEENARFV